MILGSVRPVAGIGRIGGLFSGAGADMAAITAAGEASGGSTAGQRMAGDRELEMEILRMRVEVSAGCHCHT